ncbi:AMIN domain-containing protein [Desulfovibrio mangrovi]|uniref:AMIN domain-containing protein n=1 Tax=Desulfovibrio mangrovi TaxID=2976983 RepID=UPI0022464B86|nr:AMIN domain-containing protein [Desulfovibrio mangrovi]UZP67441.1 AMIN domain-containing protein [Desulfovibrio mangrovi]
MNKNVAMLILSVVLLAMILIVLNQWAFGPASAPQGGAEFSDILKKSPVVKVPSDAPGVRIPVGNQSEAEPAPVVQPGAQDVSDVPAASDAPSAPAAIGAGQAQDAVQSAQVKSEPAAVEQVRPEPLQPAPVKPAVPAKKESVQAVAAPKVKESAKKPEPVKAAPVPVKSAPVKPAVNALQSIVFTASGNTGVLEVVAAGAFDYKVFSLKQPQRVVIDLNGNFEKLAVPSVKSNALVTGVRLARHEKSVRIVMDIAGTAPRSWDALQAKSNTLRVKLK